MLVIDATTGQNGLAAGAACFKEVAELDGIVLTKLDGTAKGGIAIAIRRRAGPAGAATSAWASSMDDLQPFDANEYVDAIL